MRTGTFDDLAMANTLDTHKPLYSVPGTSDVAAAFSAHQAERGRGVKQIECSAVERPERVSHGDRAG